MVLPESTTAARVVADAQPSMSEACATGTARKYWVSAM
jgi:hypothetical protein